MQAAAAQMRQLPYATGYFGFASEPAIRLAAKLAEITPASLTRVYLTLGGSEAVDAAVRFIVQYCNARGRPTQEALHRARARLPRLVVHRRRADRAARLPPRLRPAAGHAAPHPFAQPLPPSAGRTTPQALIAASVAALRAKVAELGADNVAAFFCEPIQGSGGVIVPPDGLAEGHARRRARARHPVRRRRGHHRLRPHRARCSPATPKACEPDLMTLAKGLTSGYVPMGATMLSERGLRDASPTAAPAGAPIGHGATYSAHPVGAAVALEVLRLYEEGGVLANGQRVAPHFAAGLRGAARAPAGGRRAPPRPAGRAGAGERQGHQARLRPRARPARPHLRRRVAQRRRLPLLRRRDRSASHPRSPTPKPSSTSCSRA